MLRTQLEMSHKWRTNRFCLAHVKSFKNPMTYASWDNNNFPDFLSWEIFMLRICFVSPKSFIIKELLSSVLNGRQSIYHSYYLVITIIIHKNINFLYHCVGACFSPYKFFFNLCVSSSLPLTLNRLGYFTSISSSKSPCKKDVFTSRFLIPKFKLIVNPKTTRIEDIFTTRENIALKSTPFFLIETLHTQSSLVLSVRKCIFIKVKIIILHFKSY